MALRHDLVNGIISLAIGVAITSYTADDDEFDRTELLLSVAVSSFLSGFFTSYFAEYPTGWWPRAGHPNMLVQI